MHLRCFDMMFPHKFFFPSYFLFNSLNCYLHDHLSLLDLLSTQFYSSICVITLNCTIPAYLASGLLIAFPCQSHAEQTLQKPPKSSNPRPNLALGALGRWQAFCSTRVNAGWPTTARVYLTKQKIRKVSAGTKSFLSVNWNSQPCMAESSPKTLAPSSL
jgi:hypothetical protein